jgi:hypothetical protein
LREPSGRDRGAGESVTLTADDVVVQRAPKSAWCRLEGRAGRHQAALTPALVQEDGPRVVSRVQNLRKDADFEVPQRIAVTVDADAEVCCRHRAFATTPRRDALQRIAFGHLGDGLCDLNGHDVRSRWQRLFCGSFRVSFAWWRGRVVRREYACFVQLYAEHLNQ